MTSEFIVNMSEHNLAMTSSDRSKTWYQSSPSPSISLLTLSDLSLFPRVPLERDNSEEFLKREARAAQLAEEIEGSATYKARVALENDERSEEEKYTAVMRGDRETHTLSRWDQDTQTLKGQYNIKMV